MSMYFLHNHLLSLTDNVFDSIFYVAQESSNISNKDPYVSIKLKSDAIDFFYSKDDNNHPVNVHQHHHLFTLPLDSTARTDYFLLHIRATETKVYKGIQKDLKSNTFVGIQKVLESKTDSGIRRKYQKDPKDPKARNSEIYYAPSLQDKKAALKIEECPNLASLQELHLCLFEELNNPQSDINKYAPETAKTAIQALEKSEVYNLIRKKFSFYKALYEWQEPNKLESKRGDVKTYYNEFLDIIINDSLTKGIPVKMLETGNWFQDPEQELEHLVRLNKDHNIDESTIEVIQNYFLKKHAVLSAVKMTTGRWSRLIINLQSLTFLCFASTGICWLNNVYQDTIILIGLGFLSFVISHVFTAIKQKNLNLFMPRALVAMASSLFLLIGSEDMFKNQLTLDSRSVFFIIIGAFLILLVFIYAESRQHSPCFKFRNLKGLYNYKIAPILVYSFNAAFILVLITQLFISNKFIERSQILYTNTFASKFDTLQYMQEHYLDYAEQVEKVRVQSMFSISLLSDMQISMAVKIDSTLTERLKAGLKSKIVNPEAVYSYLTLYKLMKKDLLISDLLIKDDLKSRKVYKSFDMLQFEDPSIEVPENLSSLSNKAYEDSLRPLLKSLINDYKRLSEADSILDDIHNHLSSMYYYHRCQDSLTRLISFPHNDTRFERMNKPTYGFHYDVNHVYCYKPFTEKRSLFKENLKSKALYPNMFILQVAIIMLLGMVGQLIISDKTVSEPL